MNFNQAKEETGRSVHRASSVSKAFDRLKLGFPAEAMAAELERSHTGQRLAEHIDDVTRVVLIGAQIAVQADRANREPMFPDRHLSADQLTLPGMASGVDRFSRLGEMLRTARTTPYWKQLRIAAFVRARGKCERCHHAFAAHLLQLHHLSYVRLGQESLADVELLCDTCHRRAHP